MRLANLHLKRAEPTKKMTFGAWNVRTLLDRDASSRPVRRTAVIARMLGKYQIDIAALTETRLYWFCCGTKRRIHILLEGKGKRQRQNTWCRTGHQDFAL